MFTPPISCFKFYFSAFGAFVGVRLARQREARRRSDSADRAAKLDTVWYRFGRGSFPPVVENQQPKLVRLWYRFGTCSQQSAALGLPGSRWRGGRVCSWGRAVL